MMKKNQWLLIGIGLFAFFLGYFMGVSNTPLRRAVRKAQKLAVKHTLQGKKDALDVLNRQNDLVNFARRKLALEEARKVIALSLGEAYIKHEMWLEALKYLSIGESLVPGDSRIQYLMGVANASLMYLQASELKKEHYYREAVQHLTTALKVNAKNYDAYYVLGLLYYRKGLISDALVQFKKILDVFPDDKKALLAVARIHYDRGELKKARQIYLHLENILPNNSKELKTVMKNLSQVERELGNE